MEIFYNLDLSLDEFWLIQSFRLQCGIFMELLGFLKVWIIQNSSSDKARL